MALTAEQLEMRRGRIGSSNVADILGYGGTEHEAYSNILGFSTFEGNEQMQIGSVLEEPIARLYIDRIRETTGRKVVLYRGDSTIVHPELPWAVATPDFGVARAVLAENDNSYFATGVAHQVLWSRAVERNVEVKCVGEWRMDGWDPEDPEGIPDYYRPQIVWQMGVTGVHVTDVVALLGGTSLHVWTIRHNERLWQATRAQVERWYHRHVAPRVPPTPDGSKAAAETLRGMYARERAALRAADLGDDILARQVLAAKAATKAAKKEEARLCQLLQQRIGDAEGIKGSDWKATWKWQDPVEVKSFTREGGRVLRITGPKGEE